MNNKFKNINNSKSITKTELKKIIDLGIPPIVILPGIPEITQHASVITGYDDKEKTILHYETKCIIFSPQSISLFVITLELCGRMWFESGKNPLNV